MLFIHILQKKKTQEPVQNQIKPNDRNKTINESKTCNSDRGIIILGLDLVRFPSNKAILNPLAKRAGHLDNPHGHIKLHPILAGDLHPMQSQSHERLQATRVRDLARQRRTRRRRRRMRRRRRVHVKVWLWRGAAEASEPGTACTGFATRCCDVERRGEPKHHMIHIIQWFQRKQLMQIINGWIGIGFRKMVHFFF